MRRVVVTGLGLVGPLGCGVETTWKRLLAGQSGASKVEAFDVSDMACRIACSIPRGDGQDGTFNPDDWMEPKEQRKVDPFVVYAMSAATQAAHDSPIWHPQTYEPTSAPPAFSSLPAWRHRGHLQRLGHAPGARPGAVALLHPPPPQSPGGGYVVDAHGLKGPNQTPW
jgi:3-oxoacyl-[acyl-carrier-protein] synthase II